MPGARTMRATAVLASALVRLATVLTAEVPGGYGGGEGGGVKGGKGGGGGNKGGDGGGDGGGGERGGDGGGEGGGEGGGGVEGGGAGHVGTVPETPTVRALGQEQTLPPPIKTLAPPWLAVLPVMVHDEKVTVPPSTKTPPPYESPYPEAVLPEIEEDAIVTVPR